jgi:P27 family predicted phage terminase small subunit
MNAKTIPIPPAWLDEIGVAKYHELAARLAGATYDGDTLALLAAAWSRHMSALAVLKSDGIVIRSGDRVWNHPAANVASSSLKEIQRLTKLLNLDEAAKPKIKSMADLLA